MTAPRFAAARHVLVARRGAGQTPVDRALAPLGLRCDYAAIVGSFPEALALARGSDLVACVPDRATQSLRDGLQAVALPFDVPEITISLLWHPRMDADLAHRWLRGCVLEVCRPAAAKGKRGR